MILRIFIAMVALGLAACETVPATMDPELFETQLSRIDDNPSVASIENMTTSLLARTDLTPNQRANVLFLRAEKRLDSRFNLPGAIADFDAFVTAIPEDPRVATAERRKIFATSEIDQAQRRLANLQNLPNWFDDKVLMGDVAAAAARYRKSGLTPNESQVYLLREAGFICEASSVDTASPESATDPGEEGSPVHNFGTLRDDVEGAVWCDNPSVS
ncbi:MAG: hypothetical protein HRT81_15880 [Henriciella sp.]|nr:hypothetical protein [Henriciella sp.]